MAKHHKINKAGLETLFLLKSQGYSDQEVAEELKKRHNIEVTKFAVNYNYTHKFPFNPNILSKESKEKIFTKIDTIINQIEKINSEAWDLYEKLKKLSDKNPSASVKAMYVLDKILKQAEFTLKLKENMNVNIAQQVNIVEIAPKIITIMEKLERMNIIKILKKRGLNDLIQNS
ncbi:MAG: hypothetical protein DRP29_03075 [Thermodesulfobacteriota bacterium]|nr:MAG: hypothetical protein DRP29_03075 [Thermodesulfobacteriota bacterium]